ncbi:MAG: hypothetical protein DYG89_27980 [Caldilinea sp. CFX5]|nr:hypothetical protein [Caldilinea sp. CFX5]
MTNQRRFFRRPYPMNRQLAFLNRTARAGLAGLALAALALLFSARPMYAATITISDQASCEAAKGEWRSPQNTCNFSDYTVKAGDTFQFSVVTVFSNLTNNGTVNANASAFVALNAINNDTININRGFRFRDTLHNTATGVINVHNGGELELFPAPVLNNDGVITINGGGELFNDGTVNNQNLIEVKCGGILSGSGAYTGNPVQINDCIPPNVTINQAAGQADPTSGSSINFAVSFSEPVSGFADSDVHLSGTAGATTAVVSGGPTNYNVAVSGMTSSGDVIAAIPAVAASDAAGNGNTASTSTDNSVTFILPDTTSPAIHANIIGTLGNNGWYVSDVAVSWTVVDNESVISSQSGCETQNVTSDTASATFTCSATSAGGTASESVTIKRDATAPTISAAATTAPNGNNWYNSDVTIRFTCADTLSGVTSCPVDQVLSSEGAALSSTAQTVSDQAGNSSAASNVVTVQIDKTAPVVTVTGVNNGASYPLGSVPAAGCSTSDALAGVATQATLTTTGGNADGTGSFTATCSGAMDNAGNSGSGSATFTVRYTWTGFFQPVDNLPTVNTVNAGQGIPVKFSLGGDFGLNIFINGYPKVQTVSCGGGSSGSTSPIDETVTAGSSTLQYDATTQSYTYVWKTDKAWAGSCRQLIVKLIDGSEHSALFQFNGKVRSADAEGEAEGVQQIFLPLVNR